MKPPKGFKPSLGAVKPSVKLKMIGGKKTNNVSVLHKALGIDPAMQLHANMLQKLVSHPNPAVAKLAKQRLNSLPDQD